MNRVLKSFTLILFLGLLPSCERENGKFHLDSIKSDKYYSKEIIPTDFLNIYGKWKLYDISCGFSGSGYEPDYDYLKIKSIGIYGLVRNNQLFEYGKIELYTFDNNTLGFLQIRLIPDSLVGKKSNMYPHEKYIELRGNDLLNLFSPCCDLYNYHYKRVK